jgi:hypothetical protein
MRELDPAILAPLAALALDCVEREYPNHVSLWLRDAADLALPRELFPAFHGCLDWHSAVHGHWLLARCLRSVPQAVYAARARDLLDRHLHADLLGRELRFLLPRPTFERPYGLAWLLRLHQDLAEWGDPDALRWRAALDPLAELAARRLREWLPRLTHPVRSGVHSQTAFAMGLALDWARALGSRETETVLCDRARDFHGADRAHALHLEPSGEDFLSPALGAADLMRRVLTASELAEWLTRALPDLVAPCEALRPVEPADRSDGRLAHLDGLNLSRAWMLLAIARRLPADEVRRPFLEALGAEHARAGLAAVCDGEYMGTHWLGSFALYLRSEVGLG